MDSNHDIVPTLRLNGGVYMSFAADEIERLRARVALLERRADTSLIPGAEPTHRCKVCGAYWRKWIVDGRMSWNLNSRGCGECCDNALMGEQIEALASPAKVGGEYLHLSRELIKALKRLSIAAQTSGGTAGRDDELMAAIQQAAEALSLSAVSRATDASEQAVNPAADLHRLMNDPFAAATAWRKPNEPAKPMNSVTEREAFMAWQIQENGWDHQDFAIADGSYQRVAIQDDWHVWKARAARSADGGEDKRDAERLDFMIEQQAWVQWTVRDGSIRQCQVYTQDEDENYHILSGEDQFFSTPREAIDAAIAANQAKGDAP